jgi:hypothetical protein
MVELDGDGSDWTPRGETVLDALDEARVFAVEATDDRSFLFVERCDDYYRVILTKEQVLLLADELRALANTV